MVSYNSNRWHSKTVVVERVKNGRNVMNELKNVFIDEAFVPALVG